MKNILVPINFETVSIEAAKVACSIASKFKSKVHFIHSTIFDNYLANFSNNSYEDTEVNLLIYKETKRKMEEFLQMDFLKEIDFTHDEDYNGTTTEMVDQAFTNHIDLIVMGSEGASGMKEYLYGSNAQKFVRFSCIPVLVVKGEAEKTNIKTITFASNFSDNEIENAHALVSLLKILKSKIHLLKVITPENFEKGSQTMACMGKFAETHNLENCTLNIVNHLDFEAGISEFAQKTNSGMIAMNTHGRTGLAHFAFGSLTENLVNHSPVSILSMKAF